MGDTSFSVYNDLDEEIYVSIYVVRDRKNHSDPVRIGRRGDHTFTLPRGERYTAIGNDSKIIDKLNATPSLYVDGATTIHFPSDFTVIIYPK